MINKKRLSWFFFLGFFASIPLVSAQGMMNFYNQNTSNTQSQTNVQSTLNDEAQGKAIWDQLQSKQIDCKTLSDDQYDLLGDYYMGQMMGTGHAAMNTMLSQTMGDAGEKQMHIVMGKRFSGCDTNAVLSPQYANFPMMRGYYNQNFPGSYNMMGQPGYLGFNVACWISLILVWTVLILSIVALARYIKSPKRK